MYKLFSCFAESLKRNPSSSDDDGIRTINDVASSQNVYGTKVPFHWNFSFNSEINTALRNLELSYLIVYKT